MRLAIAFIVLLTTQPFASSKATAYIFKDHNGLLNFSGSDALQIIEQGKALQPWL